MIAATRTRLLQLRERRETVENCRTILKGRRQALVREFIALSQPLLRSREAVRTRYAQALAELRTTRILEGESQLGSLARLRQQPIELRVVEKNLLGLRYRELETTESAVRELAGRDYNYLATTAHLEETFAAFEALVDDLAELARYEGKFRRLAEELSHLGRRIRVLENRVLPALQGEARAILQTIGERDREAYYRLKRFKEKQLAVRRIL